MRGISCFTNYPPTSTISYSGPTAHAITVLLGFTGLGLLVIYYAHTVERCHLESLPKPAASIAELAPLVAHTRKESEKEIEDQSWIPDEQQTEAALEHILRNWIFSLEGGKIVARAPDEINPRGSSDEFASTPDTQMLRTDMSPPPLQRHTLV